MATDQIAPAAEPRRRLLLPLVLFAVTFLTTYQTGGLAFCLALMFTLTAHELGHFIQARRYGVAASLPYFIPMPPTLSPIGTMGAVIAMQGRIGNRRSLYDIGITGPLAGLVPALTFSAVGLWYSEVRPVDNNSLMLGEPLIFKLLAYWIFGTLPEGTDVFLHPIGYAGWVGIFITALNLIPIGQLDGGHVLYALLRQKAHLVSVSLLALAIVAVVVMGYWAWSLMLLLLLLFGPRHAPTANDDIELGLGRTVLGYVTLMFVFVGFTPTPFII